MMRCIFTKAKGYFGIFYRSVNRIVHRQQGDKVQFVRVKANHISTVKALGIFKIQGLLAIAAVIEFHACSVTKVGPAWLYQLTVIRRHELGCDVSYIIKPLIVGQHTQTYSPING